MKTINIIAILLIITLVNSNKKLPNYEDIVQSFMEVQGDPSVDGFAKLNSIKESFTQSNELLEKMSTNLESNCKNLEAANLGSLTSIDAKLKGLAVQIDLLTQSNNQTTTKINQNIKDQVEEEKKIEEARNNIQLARKETRKKEQELIETIRILKRLKNFAEDELTGDYKIENQMVNYTVVNNYNVSFIEKTNMKEELHDLLRKSETSGKPLISTLILITQSLNGSYSDQKTVRRILDLLTKVIAKNQFRQDSLEKELHEVTKNHKLIKENSTKLLTELRENAIRDSFIISLNHKTISFYESDILYLTKSKIRREKNRNFQNDICSRHRELVNSHAGKYKNAQQRISDLRNSFEI
jgi:hypothetical protein